MAVGEAYRKLTEKMIRIGTLQSIEALVSWDEHVYMPSRGGAHRGNQLALLAGLKHEWATSPEIGDLLHEAAEEVKNFEHDSVEAVNVREWKRDYDKAVKLPKSLVEERSRVHSLAQQAWIEARKEKDFARFSSHLERVFHLAGQVADCYGYEEEAYDALMDDFEPEAKTSEVLPLLRDLRESLVPLLNEIDGSSRRPDTSLLKRGYPLLAQEECGREALAAFGYDFQRGRMDVSPHPFTITVGPEDVRITTRYDEAFFPMAFFGMLHEGGHGIYEQNLPAEHFATPMGETLSLGIHESQSRLWENLVGRSRGFWEFFYPRVQKRFDVLQGVSLEDFHFAINSVSPSFIRVEADELTYNLHILLRMELELELLRGGLKTDDVPEAWNLLMKEYFDLEVPDDAAGCLQDIHWSIGAIGYFPTYSLGNIYSAQLFDAAQREVGDLHKEFRKGRFNNLFDWLEGNIYSQGRKYPPKELIESATGHQPDSSYLVNYLRNKFIPLYGL